MRPFMSALTVFGRAYLNIDRITLVSIIHLIFAAKPIVSFLIKDSEINFDHCS